ncbi:hypothetical protein HYS03_00710 [Candidatus Woesebacteria bacterium]|nr:hypothetical protein [Candidatus Woesebacteria bacterium]QQG47184.1 MAG: hypothetical protein HY044_03525 [Candidatus Woesebacteria bacterium]
MAEETTKPEPRIGFKLVPDDIKLKYDPYRAQEERLARKQRVERATHSTAPTTRPLADLQNKNAEVSGIIEVKK